MKKIAKTLVCVICCVAVTVSTSICALAAAVSDYHSADYASIDNQIKQDVKDYHIPAMAVIVVDKDEVLFSGTYGTCSSIDTPFIIGSLSKSFTALSIMQLAEQNKINMDDKISQYIDCSDYLVNPSEGDMITVGELLNHTSGLGRYQTFANAKITSTHGEYGYSNVGYDILGKIVEAISGESYADYVAKNIFKPLDMTKSAATLEKSKENGLIEGYRNYFGIPIAGEPDYPKGGKGETVAAGYISSSAADMGKYLQMYLNGGKDIITQDGIDKMFYSGVPTDNTNTVFYGMGWSYATEFMGLEQPVLNHSGLVENYTSDMFIFPDKNIGVAVLVNMNDYLVENNILGNVILPLLGVEKRTIPQQTYLIAHIVIDVIYLAVLFFAVFPLLKLKKWQKKSHGAAEIAFDIFRHGIVAVALALMPYILGADYHMAWLFIKDAFVVIMISALLLLSTGMYKVIYAFKYAIFGRSFASENRSD